MTRNHKDILRRWMQSVIENTGWTAEKWAREAGVAPTTITRFLNSSANWLPSLKTVACLAEAAQVEMPQFAQQRHRVSRSTTSVPKISIEQLKTGVAVSEALSHTTDSVETDIAHETAFAIDVTSGSYKGGGVHPGDTMIAEMVDWSDIEDLDIVVVFLDSEVAVFRYVDGWLIPSTTSRKWYPIAAGSGGVQLVGRALKMERRLR